MKYLMLFSVIIFSISTSTFGQSDDTQWYVIGNIERKDPNQSTVGYESVIANPIPFNKFSIRTIQEACFKCYPNEDFDDDIFMIFGDGTYYNSRFDNRRGGNFTDRFWKYDNDPNVINANVNFNIDLQNSSPIEYFYWTNKYDDDDPPPISRSGQVGGFGVNNITPSSNDINNIPIFSANHDVVIDKDITLVINNKQGYFSDGFELDFKINPQPDLGTNQSAYNLPLFQPSNIFNNQSTYIYSNTQAPQNFIYNHVEINSQSNFGDFIYINLRPSANLEYILNSMVTRNPTVTFTARGIRDNSSVIETLNELVRFAHDPNFLRAKYICESSKGTYIHYEGQYQNDGGAITNFTELAMFLPPNLINEKVKLVEVIYGGLPLHSRSNYDQPKKMVNKGDSTYFGHPLVGCKDKNALSYASSLVKFKMCIGPIQNFNPLTDNYLVDSARVYFNKSDLEMNIYDDVTTINCNNRPLRQDSVSINNPSNNNNFNTRGNIPKSMTLCMDIRSRCNGCLERTKPPVSYPISSIDIKLLEKYLLPKEFKKVQRSKKVHRKLITKIKNVVKSSRNLNKGEKVVNKPIPIPKRGKN